MSCQYQSHLEVKEEDEGDEGGGGERERIELDVKETYRVCENINDYFDLLRFCNSALLAETLGEVLKLGRVARYEVPAN